jgi:hypothetical protein
VSSGIGRDVEGSLCYRPKNVAHHIFQLENELQNIPEAAPKASPSFTVSKKSSPVTVLLPYPAWNISPCLLAKRQSL